MGTVWRKELADALNSTRFLILFCLIVGVALLITNSVSLNIRAEIDRGAKDPHVFLYLFVTRGEFFSLVQFIAFFGPLMGIVLGFDAINRERNEGTLAMLLGQPIHRDSILVGKFLAGLTVCALLVASLSLLISGMGMLVIGVVPTAEQVARLAIYAVLSVLYLGFWLGLAILASVLFRSVGTSALAAIACWILVAFLVSLAANLVAGALSPIENPRDPEQVSRFEETAAWVGRTSPVTLYSEASSILLDPYRKTTRTMVLVGPMEGISMTRFNNPLDVLESTLVVAPHLIGIVELTFLCFAASYAVFLRQEIRSV